MQDPRGAVLIAGPTASGKSALAIALAERLGGVIINTDSMQVYDRLALITARPDAADCARVPHRLYGVIDPADAFSAARYAIAAAAEIAAVRAEGRVPVLVGGTGLYFEALTRGLSEVPPIPDAVRSAVRARAAELPAPALHAELAARDPEMATRLNPADTQRIARALEVILATGVSLAEHWRATTPPVLDESRCLRIVLAPDREWLGARIDRRFRMMVAAGAIAEAEAVAALGLDPALPAMRAIGVQALAEVAAGRRDLEDAITASVAETRRYAKRQDTWFRNRMTGWQRIDPRAIDADAVVSLSGCRPNPPGGP